MEKNENKYLAAITSLVIFLLIFSYFAGYFIGTIEIGELWREDRKLYINNTIEENFGIIEKTDYETLFVEQWELNRVLIQELENCSNNKINLEIVEVKPKDKVNCLFNFDNSENYYLSNNCYIIE